MKILLRHYDNEEYVWKDAEFDGDYFIVGGNRLSETRVASIIDDNRSEYVRCSACGKAFKKGSPELETHMNRYLDINNCFKCQYAVEGRKEIVGTEREEIGVGRYTVVQKYNVAITCQRCWNYDGYPVIGSDEAHRSCRYARCATAAYEDIADIFTASPGVFDDIITVDKVIEAGFKSVDANGRVDMYRLKGRNNIFACVNKMSIVEHFRINYRYDSWDIVYSKQLDKLFCINGNKYTEWNPRDVNDATKDYIKNKIAALYN